MTLYEAIVLFFIYSFLGWILESVYCSIHEKHIVNRGFLFGPLCPIYGFGSLLLLVALTPAVSQPLLVFAISFILTSLLEYVVSFLLEVLFKKSWWDYSHMPLNINGRVWLPFSLVWGGLAMLLLYVVHPFFHGLLGQLSESTVFVIAIVALVLLVADIIFSVRDNVIFNREMNRLAELSAKIDHLKEEILRFSTARRDELKAFGAGQKERLERELVSLVAQRESITDAFVARMKRILDAFPHIKLSHRDKISLRELLSNFRRDK